MNVTRLNFSKIKIEPIDQIPKFVLLYLLSFLEKQHLAITSLLSKKWKVLSAVVLSKKMDEEIAKSAIGKECWETYFGHIDKVDPMPEEMQTFLKATCTINTRRKRFQTHIPLWIPTEVNKEKLTMSLFKQCIKDLSKCRWNVELYHDDIAGVIDQPFEKAIDKSCWFVIAKDEIENTKQMKIPFKREYDIFSAIALMVSVFMRHTFKEKESSIFIYCIYRRAHKIDFSQGVYAIDWHVY